MGKKKADKKGKGKEKTALKTEKKAEKKAKKELAKRGEDDIETLIAQFHAKDQEKARYVEEKCDPPSERSNMTLTPHPDKDELIMFGGEFLAGNKIYMYNDLFFYNIKKNEWTKVTAPNAPPPRSSHQAVALKQHGGQLWIFGGEFASPTQSQFHHFKELWVYHIKNKYWERINSPGAPSSRSGHRMVQCKKLLIVFGGFHDNIRDYKYFNDVYAFNVEDYTWSKLDVSGVPPAPRSGCIMAAMPDQYRVTVYGGYSKEKVKRDIDKGTTHIDMTILMPEGKLKDETIPVKWKWVTAKQSGARPTPRCGMSCSVAPGNRAFCFGGVFDEEEDEEQIEGKFFNEFYLLDLEKNKWFLVNLRGKREQVPEKKKRRRKKEDDGAEDGAEDGMEEDGEEEMEVATDKVSNMNIEEAVEEADDTEMAEGASNTMFDDGVFQVKIGPALGSTTDQEMGEDGDKAVKVFQPHPRMGPLMVVKNGILFLYGGMFEKGDKQFTFKDFYSLDLDKMEEWKVLIENDESKLVWDDSGSSDEEMEACGGEEEGEDSSDDDDIEDILEGCDVPTKNEDENMEQYFERTKDFWVEQSQKYFENEEMKVSSRTVSKFAKEMCQEFINR
ncbi:kelch domain-containing protein 4-like [Saccostrea echinata]|uniref:kelch domain-containing protein 4-like n=1 Tax=Saccostrea echinata TaxID=191078 RepID=UPI002A829BC0|nr:kelch domain-containing protein 4-like [Saccostrea echinata]